MTEEEWRAEARRLAWERAEARRLVLALAERVLAQHELLARRAERSPAAQAGN